MIYNLKQLKMLDTKIKNSIYNNLSNLSMRNLLILRTAFIFILTGLLSIAGFGQNVLDNISISPSAAYSLRLLNSSYSGPLVQICVDNNIITTFDVYPDPNNTFSLSSPVRSSTGSLLSLHIATTSVATITKWYDQSGHANNAVQSNSSFQPLIISNGSIKIVNGLPAITFTNASQFLISSIISNGQTVNAVRNIQGSGYQYLFSMPANTDFSVRCDAKYNGTSPFNTYTQAVVDNPSIPNAQDWCYLTSPYAFWINGKQTFTATNALHTVTSSSVSQKTNMNFTISSTFQNRGMSNGDAVSELILFPSTLSTSIRQTLESNQLLNYNIMAAITPPTPSLQNVCVGSTPSQFAVTVSGASHTYQWYSNNKKRNVGGTLINGATSYNYIPPASTTAGTVYYYVVVDGTSTSGVCYVNNLSAPIITSQPSASTVVATVGSTATPLTVAATCATSYQWYSNTTNTLGGTVAIGAGNTTASYTPSTTGTGITYYYVTVKGCGGSTTSNISGEDVVLSTLGTSSNYLPTSGGTLNPISGATGPTLTVNSNNSSGSTLTVNSNKVGSSGLTLSQLKSNTPTVTTLGVDNNGNVIAGGVGSFTVYGSDNTYYPVVFSDPGYDNNIATELELGRSDVHENDISKTWTGSLIAKFKYHTTNWGNGSQFIDADIKSYDNDGNQYNFIAGWKDATSVNNSRIIIIWLKGGNGGSGITYNFRSNLTIGTPVVYDGNSNAIPTTGIGSITSCTAKTTIDDYVNNDGLSTNSSIYSVGENNNYFLGSLNVGTKNSSDRLHVSDGSLGLDNGVGNHLRAGSYLTLGNSTSGNFPYISFNAQLTNSQDISGGTSVN